MATVLMNEFIVPDFKQCQTFSVSTSTNNDDSMIVFDIIQCKSNIVGLSFGRMEKGG